MGFSVSGSAAIIFAALFIAFGMWYSASANSFERMNEAEDERAESIRAAGSSSVEIADATYNSTSQTLNVSVENTGAAQLTLDDTDLLVDGQYRSGWQSSATVEGYGDTRLWMGAEVLDISVSQTTEPTRVKVVAETGVADTSEVTVVS